MIIVWQYVEDEGWEPYEFDDSGFAHAFIVLRCKDGFYRVTAEIDEWDLMRRTYDKGK